MSESIEDVAARVAEQRKGKTPKRTPTGKEKRLANLKEPWKPGECPNPDGRPKGSVSLTAILKQKLAEVPEGEKRTRAEMLVDATWRDAMKGDSAARKLAWEYIEGQARQTVDITATVEVSAEDARSKLADAIARGADAGAADCGTGESD